MATSSVCRVQAAAAARFDEAFKNNAVYTNVPLHQNNYMFAKCLQNEKRQHFM
jgi:hypothetical protein